MPKSVKAPQDHRKPGVFTYRTEAGEKVTLPSLSAIPSGLLRKYRKLPEVDFMFSVLEDAMDEEELAKLDAVSISEVERLFEAWQADEGATFPES